MELKEFIREGERLLKESGNCQLWLSNGRICAGTVSKGGNE